MKAERGRRSGWAVFRAPAAIAVASCFGLVASLIGDGAWDWLGAAALLAPVLASGTRPFGQSADGR